MAEISEQEFGEYKNRVKSLEHRVAGVEDSTKAIYEQNATLKELVVEVRHTNEHLSDHETRLDELEGKDKKTIGSWRTAAINAVTNNIVLIIIGLIVWGITLKGGA